MRVFKTRWFARFAKAESISDDTLATAIQAAERGLIDAELGAGLIKLRVARKGGGKRGGFRTLIAYRAGIRAVFLFGFAKSERDNISSDQLHDLRAAAAEIIGRAQAAIDEEVGQGRLLEVPYDEDPQGQ